jgi:hypothetical protein
VPGAVVPGVVVPGVVVPGRLRVDRPRAGRLRVLLRAGTHRRTARRCVVATGRR